MSSGHNKSSGLHRKPGDWKRIAEGRSHESRILRMVDPMTCAPKIGEVGSAAYRRMIRK